MKTLTNEAELEAYLREANKQYRLGTPIISDSEFDQIEDSLRAINPNNKFLGELNDHDFGVEKSLTIHMGSQDKALNLGEMDPFYRRAPEKEYHWSEKLDGMSMELCYHNGHLFSAVTRGDGLTGVDVTSSVSKIPSVPKKINHTGVVVVRGEVMLLVSQLEALNKQLVSEGRKPMDNVRNGTVGIIKAEKNRKYAVFCTFKAYDLMIQEYEIEMNDTLFECEIMDSTHCRFRRSGSSNWGVAWHIAQLSDSAIGQLRLLGAIDGGFFFTRS